MHNSAVHIALMGKKLARRITKDHDPATLKDLGERLQWSRHKAGYEDATEGAEALGFGSNKSTYYGHENGSRGFKRDTAAKYARFYKVDLDWLVTGRGTPRFGTLGKRIDQLDSDTQSDIEQYVDFLTTRGRAGAPRAR